MMIYFAESDLEISLPDVHQHWDAYSEFYAGGDALITLMAEGWALGDIVYCEHHWLASGIRYVDIYHVELRRRGYYQNMALIDNPFIEHLIGHTPLIVLPLSQPIHH